MIAHHSQGSLLQANRMPQGQMWNQSRMLTFERRLKEQGKNHAISVLMGA